MTIFIPNTRQNVAARLRRHEPDYPRQDVVIIPGMPAAPEPCTLARHWSEILHPANAVAQLKKNGVRSLGLQGRIVTREAIPLDCALHCLPALRDLDRIFGEPMVIDAEYCEIGGLDATLSAMKSGEGAGVMWIFDAVPYREWKVNRFTTPLDDRLGNLEHALSKLCTPFVGFLPAAAVSACEVPHLADIAYRNGEEGLVVKDADAVYYRGRSPIWLKVKNQITREARIMDMVVEDGRAKTLICKLLDGGKTVRVGTNIPEPLREKMALWAEEFAGAVIEIGATDTNDKGGLTGVHFITMRPDRA